MSNRAVRAPNAPVILVSDEAVVMRASEVVARMGGRDLRDVAAEIGVSHSTLWRFLQQNGFRHQWVRAPAEEAGRE